MNLDDFLTWTPEDEQDAQDRRDFRKAHRAELAIDADYLYEITGSNHA